MSFSRIFSIKGVFTKAQMVKQLENTQRAQIVALLEQGLSAEEVGLRFGVHRTTITRIKSRYEKTSSFDHRGGNGRPKTLCSSTLGLIKKEFNKNPKNSLRKVAKSIEKEKNIIISHATVRNGLNSMNKFAFSPIKKPLLSKKNIKARLEFAKLILKTNIETIKRIIFSDECKFELINTKNKMFVWREPGTELNNKHLTPTVKFGGGSIMVWGCFSYCGVGKLVFIDGIMDAALYCSILSDNLMSSASELGMCDLIFQ